MRHQKLVTLLLLTAVATLACENAPARPTTLSTSSVQDAAAAKGAGKPPTYDRAVTAEFRCPGPACIAADRIRGDGAPYAVNLGGDGNLAFALTDPSRSVTFDFTDCVTPCAAVRRWFTTASVGSANDLWMHTSVLVPGTSSEVAGGFHAIPVGETWSSRIKILWKLTDPAGTEFAWAIRFNPFFAGSTNLQVTRTSDVQWLVEATPLQAAWTQTAPTGRRAGDPTFEGNYVMPFQIRVTVQ